MFIPSPKFYLSIKFVPIKSKINRWIYILFFSITFIPCHLSAAVLTLGDNLALRDIDDKAVEQSFFSQKRLIELAKGQHTLVLKYKDVFEDLEFAEDKLVKSDYFVVKFSIEDQKNLFLTTSKISNLAQAERFAKSPELSLLDENKRELVLVLQTLNAYELANQVNKQLKKVVTALPRTAQEQIADINSDIGGAQSKKEQDFNNKIIDEVDAVPMLKYWWAKANEEQRAKFIQFINKKTQTK